jgi:hypothetical protein
MLSVDINTLPTTSPSTDSVFTSADAEPKKDDQYVLIGYNDVSHFVLQQVFKNNRIEVAPAAHRVDLVKLAEEGGQKLPPQLSSTLDEYDYYNIEMGLNIILSQGYNLTELRFKTEIYGDDNLSDNVIAYDIFPDDQVKRVTIVEGEISLGVTELFNLVPAPVGTILANLLKVKLNPWKFSWGYDKIEIQSSEGLTYSPEWLLRYENIYRGFNPTLIIKKKKDIKKIVAKTTINFDLKLPRDHFLQLRRPIIGESDHKEIAIL